MRAATKRMKAESPAALTVQLLLSQAQALPPEARTLGAAMARKGLKVLSICRHALIAAQCQPFVVLYTFQREGCNVALDFLACMIAPGSEFRSSTSSSSHNITLCGKGINADQFEMHRLHRNLVCTQVADDHDLRLPMHQLLSFCSACGAPLPAQTLAHLAPVQRAAKRKSESICPSGGFRQLHTGTTGAVIELTCKVRPCCGVITVLHARERHTGASCCVAQVALHHFRFSVHRPQSCA